MKIISIDKILTGCVNISKGDRIAFQDKAEKTKIGTVRIRAIFCGKKGCTKCPHKYYAYAQYREGQKIKSKYLGLVF